MELRKALDGLVNGDELGLRYIYTHFRPAFMSWMNSAHKNHMHLSVETYKYAIASIFEAVIENEEQFQKESEVKVYLFSVAKNKLLAEAKGSNHLSYQADLEEEAIEDQTDKSIRIEKLKKLVSIQGYPCKDLLKYYYFNGLSKEKIAEKLEYKMTHAVEELKNKCVERINKLLTIANEEV